MKSGFIGTRSVLSQAELESLLETHAGNNGWYFLRWAHEVSGFKKGLPTAFNCIEGQVFTGDRELRWKPQGQGFNLLLLSTAEIQGFELLQGNWVTQDRDAHVYPLTETRLPKGIAHNNANVGQRYFIDQTTWTVHFIALVAKEAK
jgi:hypothetical protein